MNLSEYRALPPEEKNALFAEHVMGWKWIVYEGFRTERLLAEPDADWAEEATPDLPKAKIAYCRVPDCLNDLNACFEGVEKIEGRVSINRYRDSWGVRISELNVARTISHSVYTRLNDAIMETCLMAVGVIE